MLQLLREVYGTLSSTRRWQLLAVLVLMLIGAAAEMFTIGAVVPFLGMLVKPQMLDQHPGIVAFLAALAEISGWDRLKASVAVFCVIATITAGLRLLLNWAGQRYVFAVGADLAKELYSITLRQSYLYHMSRNSAETMASIDKVGQLVMGVMVPCMQALIALVMVLTIFSAMLWVNVGASLSTALVFGGMYLVINLRAKKILHANGKIISENATQKFKALQEGLGGIRDVILSRSYDIHVNNFSVADRKQRTAQAINAVLAASPKYLVESVGMIMIVLMAYYMTMQDGVEQAIATLGVLAIGAQRLLPYMQTLYGSYASAKGNLPASQEVMRLVHLRGTQLSAEVSSPVSHFSGLASIEIQGVSFSYDSNRQILSGVDLVIRSGERVGLVGVTGGGKSTLIDILTGLVSPQSGRVLVDGIELNERNIPEWQRNIAYVPQSIFLLDASIEENIVLGGGQGVDAARLKRALTLSQLDEVVEKLPAGLQTRVGERGVQLSGGQRQRIGIARALYREAKMLVLDEATSALDSETEKRVMEGIYQLRSDMIILMIAHRLSTLDQCTAIYEVGGGGIRATQL
jgi:ABC-type multidrug transport system fused ATPase/permease subunit